ncbi:MAG: hypothetical protein Salg2KO_16080 [Salibacteraceae bacterium]
MAELKTKRNDASVDEFLSSITNRERVQDCKNVMKIMVRVTNEPAAMWGSSLIGYGSYRYRYKTGRQGEWFLTGLSPRKNALSIYILSGFDRYEDLLNKLGKHSTGKGCLYIKDLNDVDPDVLEQLIQSSVSFIKSRYN